MQRMPYVSDPKLIPRVQKYLEANVDKTYVDIGLMADELQNSYREYSRRKRSAFRASVKKAYSIVLRSYGLEDQNDSSSDEEVEEAESENSREGHFQHSNMMNNQLVDMYSRASVNVPEKNDNELIDISSDDSKEETQPVLSKASNGPSTSVKMLRPDVSIHFSNNFKGNTDRCEKITLIQGKKRKLDDETRFQSKKKMKTQVMPTYAPETPKVNFDDVVGIDSTLNKIEEILFIAICPTYDILTYGTSPASRAILLHGPSGCGKTLLAHAIAGQLEYPLIKVEAADLVRGISGESEKLIKELFEKGVSASPCVLFIDNIDIITNNQSNSQNYMQKRIISQLCSCLDELHKNPLAKKVIFIGATRNLGEIDPSLKIYGRLYKEIKLGIPNEESRIAILKKYSCTKILSPGFDWNRVGAVTPGFVGTDLIALINKVHNRVYSRFYSNHKNELIISCKTARCNENQNIFTEDRESDKTEPEIIVDDDPKESLDKNNRNSNQEENHVLVIEDENSKQEDENISSSTVPKETNNSDGAMPVVATEKENDTISELVKKSLLQLNSSTDWNWTRVEKKEYCRIESPVVPEHLKKYFVVTEDDFLEAAKMIKPSSIREGLANIPNICWDDVGSLKDIKKELISKLLGASKHKERIKLLGLTKPAGILLCGPPGCGKTMVAKALANEARINFFSVKGPELLNMYVGESEKAVRMCFERAKNSAPCIIFFDELDALCPRRSTDREGDVISRVVNQILTEMDGVEDRNGVYLLAATNKPDTIDPAVLRPGRLDKILYVGMPSPADRVEILKTITKNGTNPPISPDVNLEDLCNSEKMSWFTGADLSALVGEAAQIHFNRTENISDDDFDGMLTSQDFEEALNKTNPSVLEEERKLYEQMKEKYSS